MSDETRVSKPERETVVPEPVESEPTYSPAVDIIEKADSVAILADMPGVSRDDVEVVLEKGVLSIDARLGESRTVGMKLQRQEFELGSFHRCFSVGEGLDPEGIEATMKDGVLRLVIPMAERYQPRRIEIKGK